MVGTIVERGPEVFRPEIPVLENPAIKLGTDGLRGPGTIMIGHAEAFAEATIGALDADVVIVGRDSRNTGPAIRDKICDAAVRFGVTVIDAGIIPTPALAWLTRQFARGKIGLGGVQPTRNVAANMITASHNKPVDNGEKAFDKEGRKLQERDERRLESLLNLPDLRERFKRGGEGSVIVDDSQELVDCYVDYIVEDANEGLPAGERLLEGDKVVVDAAYGAAYYTAPTAIAKLGGNIVEEIGCEANGDLVNVECGATHTDRARAAVLANDADYAVVFDADADRTMMVTKKGNIIDGDHMALALILAELQTTESDVVHAVGTIMSNGGLVAAAREAAERISAERGREIRVEFHRADVGDTAVGRKMDEVGASIGTEQSGHVVLDGIGDGLRASLRVLKATKQIGISLDDLYEMMPRYAQVLVNAEMPSAEARDQVADDRVLREAMWLAKHELHELGINWDDIRAILRPSGTEPLVRAMVELPPGWEREARLYAERLGRIAEDRAWGHDYQVREVITLGGQQVSISTGRDARLFRALREMSKSDPDLFEASGWSDLFTSRQGFEEWYMTPEGVPNQHIASAWDADGRLIDIRWQLAGNDKYAATNIQLPTPGRLGIDPSVVQAALEECGDRLHRQDSMSYWRRIRSLGRRMVNGRSGVAASAS